MQVGFFLLPSNNKEGESIGARLTGYDIVRQRFPPHHEINPLWQLFSRQYGFHLTVGGMVETTYSPSKVAGMMRRQIVFDRELTLGLAPPTVRSGIVYDEIQARCMLDAHLLRLHLQTIAIQSRIITGSMYQEWINVGDPRTIGFTHVMNKNIMKYGSPGVGGLYKPHVTLLDPVPKDQSLIALEVVNGQTRGLESVIFDRFAMVIREGGNSQCTIYDSQRIK